MRRKFGLAVAIVCGFELVIAVIIGGASAAIFFGWEGALVAIALVWVAFELIGRRRPSPS